MINFIIKRRENISNHLIEFIFKDLANLVSSYDYWLEGIADDLKEEIDYIEAFPDGRIVGQKEGKITIYDLTTQKYLLDTLEHANRHGHGNPIDCALILSDGMIITGSTDSVKIWNPLTGDNKKVILDEREPYAYIFAEISNEKIIINQYCGIEMNIWDKKTLETKRVVDSVYHEFTNAIRSIAITSNKYIVCGDEAGKIRVWAPNYDNTYNKFHKLWKGHDDAITCCIALSSNNESMTKICTGSLDKTIKIWSLDPIGQIEMEWINDSAITCIVELPDKRIMCGTIDGEIFVWDIVNKYPIDKIFKYDFKFKVSHQKISNLKVLSDGRVIIDSDHGIIKICS